MDRSLKAYLGLPIFDQSFVNALSSVGLGSAELWLTLDEAEPADEQIARILPALGGSQEDKDVILLKLDLVPILATVIHNARGKIVREIASELGFGSVVEGRHSEAASSGASSVWSVADSEPQAKKPKPAGATQVISSLRSEEDRERFRWASRLQQIACRAGRAAKINGVMLGAEVLEAEQMKIKSLIFQAGAYRTIRQNVLAWEKMEAWATDQGLTIYPLSSAVLLKYCLHLDRSSCGPSVIPALKYAVKWICRRIVMEAPDMSDPGFGAIITRIYEERGKELREAVPVDFRLVVALELLMQKQLDKNVQPAGIFLWWTLILIYASLRFDDGRHVDPTSLTLSSEALLGLVWQTKVERRRRGTRFAVPLCSMSGTDWLELGWKAFQPFCTERDYFICDLKSETEFDAAPVSYLRSLQWLRFFAHQAVDSAEAAALLSPAETPALRKNANEITWHSMRATMLSAAVKAHVDDKIIALQANWKDPSQLVLKYARQRKELSVQMVQDLAAKIREQWNPDPGRFEVCDDIDVVEPSVTEYVVKSSLPPKALSDADLRYHLMNTSFNRTHTLCGRLALADATSFGPEQPGIVCSHCQNKLDRQRAS